MAAAEEMIVLVSQVRLLFVAACANTSHSRARERSLAPRSSGSTEKAFSRVLAHCSLLCPPCLPRYRMQESERIEVSKKAGALSALIQTMTEDNGEVSSRLECRPPRRRQRGRPVRMRRCLHTAAQFAVPGKPPPAAGDGARVCFWQHCDPDTAGMTDAHDVLRRCLRATPRPQHVWNDDADS